MSFSLKTKNEMSRILVDKDCCQTAELAALIRVGGSIEIKPEGKIGLKFSTENAQVARKVFILIKKQFNLNTELLVRRKRRLKKNNNYLVIVPPENGAQILLRELNIVHESRDEGIHLHYGINEKIIENFCCKKAYIRGAFLSGGYISDPEKNYHLEIVLQNEKTAEDLSSLINTFDLNSKVLKRKDSYVVYLKEGEQIVKLLNIMGAHTALLNLENVRIFKDMRNKVNRLVNCETANLGKTIEASLRQTENILYIKNCIGLKHLSPPLKEIAELRLNFPDANLRELGKMIDPPIGKSGVNHRLRKLESIAKELKKKRGDL
ncbi:MAG: cell division protein WhiA [Thermosediminibacterales bacterium]|nr:cell division protein WhiA [Thermosediminibacterales bacterium]MDK2835240.1 cell division protein WhiA [Thermosediminibacterales bacterium]